jgi:hypothetical protein
VYLYTRESVPHDVSVTQPSSGDKLHIKFLPEYYHDTETCYGTVDIDFYVTFVYLYYLQDRGLCGFPRSLKAYAKINLPRNRPQPLPAVKYAKRLQEPSRTSKYELFVSVQNFGLYTNSDCYIPWI